MRVRHIGYRIQGFYRVAALGHLWAMTPKDAQRRLEILRFFDMHGLAATCDAFGVSRRTLYRWQAALKAQGGNPAALAAKVSTLRLGRHFDLAEEHWSALCARIEQILSHQGVLMPVELPEAVETQAQVIAARLLARTPVEAPATAEFAEVDVNSLELVQPRSVGVEHVGLHALAELGLDALLASLGVNAVTRAMIFAQIIGRMAAPGSERATWGWLDETSALPELLDPSLPDLSIMRLYRASDALLEHQTAIEAHLFERVRDLFGLEVTVTLYDLTNTYFEGTASGMAKAQRGHSKEKRSDCPLLTLGLVLDASGFVRRSRVLAGNAVECRTLEDMLEDLGVPAGALIVMDRGIATEENLVWLREKGYRYLVVSRARARCMPVACHKAI